MFYMLMNENIRWQADISKVILLNKYTVYL